MKFTVFKKMKSLDTLYDKVQEIIILFILLIFTSKQTFLERILLRDQNALIKSFVQKNALNNT